MLVVAVMRRVDMVKLDLATGKSQKVTDYVAEEVPLYLFVNRTFWAMILCLPSDLKELAVGHLLSEGVLKSTAEIEEITLKEAENTCIVKLKQDIDAKKRVRLSRLHTRVICSACSSSMPYQYARKPAKVTSNIAVKAQVIFNAVTQLNCKADGTIVAFAEDIGRHNAVDKSVGIAALKNVDFGKCFLAFSGRMPSDIVFKVAKVGLPIIASFGAALDSGIALAKQTNLTLIGFVREKRMNIYTGAERIISEAPFITTS
jgi:formate dehydrogenase accessory protein FdhD